MKLTSWLIAVAISGMAVVACEGDDGDTSPTSALSGDADARGSGGSGGLEIAGSVDDANLLVAREYLQGVWCDSDGQTWTIEGDTARTTFSRDGC